MICLDLQQNIDMISEEVGQKDLLIIKKFYIGKVQPLDAALIYVNGLADKTIIDRDILNPLMFKIEEDLPEKENLADYISKKYISMSNTYIKNNLSNIVHEIKRGNSAILINQMSEAIILDTKGGQYRSIGEPENETTIKGPREGFIENLSTNLSILRRRIKDKNLVIEQFVLGQRSEVDVAIVYLENLADTSIVNELRKRINLIDVDKITDSGVLQQYLEESTYSVFPQSYATERPDVVTSNILEGKIAIIVSGTPFVITVPAVFIEFFQTVEDYNFKTVPGSLFRLLRVASIFIVITLPSIYLTLIKFNAELIPIKFITPIVQSRIGIALTPFLEIMGMEVLIEILREGGLRLPSKVAQTLSVVGGIIIGDTAVRSKMVSPTTLFLVGITVVTSFVIPNIEMSLAIRLLRFPMLIISNFLGIYGIGIGWFLIIVHLFSLENFGVPYLEFTKNDMLDTFIRAPIWMHNKRPEVIPNKDPIRQTDFRKKWKN